MQGNDIKLKITIDGKEAVASINLTDNELKKLASSMRNANEAARNTGSTIVHSFAEARNLIQGFRETVSILTSAFNSSLSAFQQQEKANMQLATALKQSGSYTQENYNELIKYSQELQKFTIYGDDATTMVMAQLSAMGLNTQQIKTATLQVANLASLMGTDLSSAARVMGDLFNGNATMINRYIKGLDETILKSGDLNAIIDMVNKSIGNQAVALGETSLGAVAKFNNAIDDVKESIGEVIATALTPLLNHLNNVTTNLNNTSPALMGFVGAIGTLTVSFSLLSATGIMPFILNVTKLTAALKYGAGILRLAAAEGIALQGAMIGAGTAVKGLMASIGPIGWIVLGLGLVIEAVDLLSSSAKSATEEQEKLNASLKAMTLQSLRGELNNVDIAANSTRNRLYELKSEYQLLAKKDSTSLDDLKNKLGEIGNYQISLNKLNEYRLKLVSEIKTKEDEIKSSIEQQYEQLRELLDVELQKGDVNKQIEQENQRYSKRIAIIKEYAIINKLTDQQLKKDLLDAEKAHNDRISEIKSKASDDRKNKLFTDAKNILDETHRHNESILKIETDNDLLVLSYKIKHFEEMIALYKKFGQDVTNLIHQKVETEKELENKKKVPIELEPEIESEDETLKDIINIEDYKKSIRVQSRQDELDNWYKTEQERLAQYETNVAAQTALDDEYAARKKILDQETINAQLSSAAYAFAAIGSMVGKHTALGQMAAVAQSLYNTYEAATKALTVGPILGPILAGIITALGLAQVAKIKETASPTGYAQGGRLKKGQQGFIEGYDNEIIAPEKTFVEIFKNELRPQIYNSTNINRLELLMNSYLKRIENWSNSIELTSRLKSGDLYLSTERGRVNIAASTL